MADGTGKRILLIEDDPTNMELAADLLEAGGFTVFRAATAEEGLRLAAREKPDLVLMDIALPGMDGLEATRRLKNDPATAGIPVVAVSASVMGCDHEAAMEAGCSGFITKPLDTRRFVKTISLYIR